MISMSHPYRGGVSDGICGRGSGFGTPTKQAHAHSLQENWNVLRTSTNVEKLNREGSENVYMITIRFGMLYYLRIEDLFFIK